MYNYSKDRKTRVLVDDHTGEILAEEITAPGYAEGAQAIAAAMAKAMPLFKTPYNHDREAASLASSTAFPEIGKAIQSQKDQADINVIVNQFLKTGELPPVSISPQFMHLEDLDFMQAMDIVNEGRRSFEQLPEKVRKQFDHNPGMFLAYVDHCLQTGDLAELGSLGLAVSREPPQDAKEGKTPEGGTPPPPAAKETAKDDAKAAPK